jgi:hypothetical protein
VTLKEGVMRKRLLLVAVTGLVCAGLAGLLLVWLTHPKPGVTRANYGRIRQGMTLEDVEAVLGMLPTYKGGLPLAEGGEVILLDGLSEMWWEGDEISVGLGFNAQGTVCDKTCLEFGHREGLLDRLRRLFPW